MAKYTTSSKAEHVFPLGTHAWTNVYTAYIHG